MKIYTNYTAKCLCQTVLLRIAVPLIMQVMWGFNFFIKWAKNLTISYRFFFKPVNNFFAYVYFKEKTYFKKYKRNPQKYILQEKMLAVYSIILMSILKNSCLFLRHFQHSSTSGPLISRKQAWIYIPFNTSRFITPWFCAISKSNS